MSFTQNGVKVQSGVVWFHITKECFRNTNEKISHFKSTSIKRLTAVRQFFILLGFRDDVVWLLLIILKAQFFTMKKLHISVALLFLLGKVSAQEVAIIPQPVSVQPQPGTFTLKNSFSIGVSSQDADSRRVAEYLSKKISIASGFASEISKLKKETVIRLRLLTAKNKNGEIGREGYLLQVYQDSVAISANEPSGLFYGVQTFLQLFPKEIESKAKANDISW